MRNVLTNEADVWLPKMPAKDNAEYEVWKIAFQKVWDKIDFTRPVILTARSLGTIFLVKWLSENDFLHRAENILPLQKRIDSLHLIGSVFDGEGIMEE
jgi:predicted alpha/beta hydrolase family esterase